MSGTDAFPLVFSKEEDACALCGHPGPFAPVCEGASLRETRCPACRSSRRNRDLARVLLHLYAQGAPSLRAALDGLKHLRIYELQAKGALHDVLSALPGYCCSEYLPHVPPGSRSPEGVQCQDATALTFADGAFDIVISQDVLEHIGPVWTAFGEIQRVLAPGGRHIFTVPVHAGSTTTARAAQMPHGAPLHLLPPVHHKDPLNPEGALVFWDFGDDLPEILHRHGIRAGLAAHCPLYPAHKVCRVTNAREYARYQQHKRRGSHVLFFLYNSHVFITQTG